MYYLETSTMSLGVKIDEKLYTFNGHITVLSEECIEITPDNKLYDVINNDNKVKKFIKQLK